MRRKHSGKVTFPFSAIIGKHAEFEGSNAIGERSAFGGHMGHHSYMAKDCDLKARVGRFTSIGSNVRSVQYRHPTTYPFATTSPAFYSLLGQCGGDNYATEQSFDESVTVDAARRHAVEIGSDCWINSDVLFVSGVKVGDGAVVLAGAVVTRDVPPYAVVAGVPAKVIKYRYDEKDVEWLLRVRWWDLPQAWLRENWRLLSDIKRLKEALKCLSLEKVDY